jgi:O-antigen/teichoic acid export membrane protein
VVRAPGGRGAGERELSSTSSRLARLGQRLSNSELFRQVAHTLTTRVVLLPLGLVASVMVTRALGPEGRGEFAVATTLAALAVQLSNLGLPSSNTVVVARQPERLGAVTANALLSSAALGGLTAAVLWAIAAAFPRLAPANGGLLALCLLWVPLGLAYLLVQNLLIAIQQVRISNRAEVVQRLIGIALIALVVVAGWATATTAFLASLVALGVSLAFLFAQLAKRLGGATLRPDRALFAEHLGYGLRSYFTSLCAYAMLRIDLLMVQYLRGAEQVGYYSVAVGMADLLYMIPSTVGTLLFPRLSAMTTREEKWRATNRTTLLMAAALAPLALVASLLAPWITRLLFGARFLPAVPAFVWLMPGIVAYGSTFASLFLLSVGLPAMVLVMWAGFVILNVALNLVLIPRYGFVGASISSSITYTACFVVLTLYARRLASAAPAGRRP